MAGRYTYSARSGMLHDGSSGASSTTNGSVAVNATAPGPAGANAKNRRNSRGSPGARWVEPRTERLVRTA